MASTVVGVWRCCGYRGALSRFAPTCASEPTASANDLTVVFAGFTNDPVFTPSRVAVAGPGKGLHALFAVTNRSPTNFIRFKTVSVESRIGTSWRHFEPNSEWRGMSGRIWAPGFGVLCAVAWPAGLPTSNTWRLQLSVAREPSPLRRMANEELGRELFQPAAAVMMPSPEVGALAPGGAMTFELLPR